MRPIRADKSFDLEILDRSGKTHSGSLQGLARTTSFFLAIQSRPATSARLPIALTSGPAGEASRLSQLACLFSGASRLFEVDAERYLAALTDRPTDAEITAGV